MSVSDSESPMRSGSASEPRSLSPDAVKPEIPWLSAKRTRVYWIAAVIILAIALGGLVNRTFGPAPGGTPSAAARAANDHIVAGMAAYRAGDLVKAEVEFRKAVQSDPSSALAYNDLGSVLNDQHRWDEAIVTLRKAIELNPSMDLPRNNLQKSFAQKAEGGNFGPNPDAARAASEHLVAGMNAYHAANLAGAEAEFRKAVEADPRSALAYNDLGSVFNDQRRWDEAIAALEKAVELNPALALAKNNLAKSYSGKAGVAGNTSNAEAVKAANSRIEAGMTAYHAGDLARAEAEFRASTQADPYSALGYNDLGAVLNDRRQWDDAAKALRRALELNPGLELAKTNLSIALSRSAQGGAGRYRKRP